MLALVATALAGFVIDGGGAPRLAEAPSRALSFGFWSATLATSENNVAVLSVAAAAGATLAMALPILRSTLSASEAVRAFARGIRSGAYAVGILLLAWALAAVCKDLGTGQVVVRLLGDTLSPAAIPVATFCAAAGIAFSTGTSWGTMAMLIPVAVPLAHDTGEPIVLVITLAAILDGAIFGDHCSPISDTTLMSSIASGSDHLDHVVTQLPYAMTAMVIALLVGYLPTMQGTAAWIAYLGGALAVVAVLLVFGRRAA
jgi:Na+/H+ antiporter NhaC